LKAFYQVVKPEKADDAEISKIYDKYSSSIETLFARLKELYSKPPSDTNPQIQEALTRLLASKPAAQTGTSTSANVFAPAAPAFGGGGGG
uniref:hypothetical protein n=1 Tax=Salmonella sp. SAL4457 TaxID=3159912 RepID=UPI00397E099F